MEKIVSDDVNIADEKNLLKPEDVAGVEARDEEKKEDIAKEEISISVEDKGSHDSTDLSVETDDKTPEPPSPKEPAISETVAEEVKGVDESSKVAEEVSTNAVEVSLQIPKEELPLNGAKEVQVETLGAEKNVDDHNADSDHNVSETIEVAEHVAKTELDAEKENLEKNLGIEMTTSTETTQSIAEGVEVSKDAKDENFEGQNLNLVELSRDIKMVEAESNVPSDDKQCESKELETELKPNKQTLLDTFENENTEDKEQETEQVGAGSLTETKADEEVTKAELSGKKPKTIISKVKQSIVKVKKALIGKSLSSKTMAPEVIDETKAK